MAENAVDEQKAGQVEQTVHTDWESEYKRAVEELEEAKRQSRKWEDRSKSNAEKAKKYDELAAQSMTDAERIDAEKARADEAVRKLREYETEAQRVRDASEVSEKYGVPVSLITECDRKSMEAQAMSIKAFAEGQPASRVFHEDGKRASKPRQTPRDSFAEFINQIAN